jgi:hypothetical protein
VPAIDPAQLAADIQAAATAAIGKDVATLRGFSLQQVNAIAQQSVYVAGGIADGSIDDSTRSFFLDSLKDMVRSFINVLAGIIVVMAEEVWNAVVGVIWTAISKATGLVLAAP